MLGLGVGVGGTSAGQLWWDSHRPNPVSIQQVDVEPLQDGGYKLVVHMRAPRTPSCLRLAEHVISPSPDNGEPGYQPLASALAGGDFTRGGTIKVDLKVHPFMVHPGETWFYTYRAAYECTRFPGLLRVSEWQSAPIPVTF
jgi:hypothetical protein